MKKTICRLTVYFDDPFWIGLYEREYDGWYEASKIIFGAEPKDGEVYAFLLHHWNGLRFSPPVSAEKREKEQPINPKRMQRAVRRTLERAGCGTKAQRALAAWREQEKRVRCVRTREQREREAAERFEKRRQRQKEKHRGH